jgi:Fe-S-cluster-containing hydrogenase component 2
VSEVDPDLCSECGDCHDGRCPVSAISDGDGATNVDGERCIGCGVCSVACTFDAIQLVPRPEEECVTPPETIVHWSIDRVDHRKGKLKGAAMRGWIAWEGLKMAARRRAEN